MRATGLLEFIGEGRLFPTADAALEAIHVEAAARGEDHVTSPLRPVPQERFA
jgi:hypothetical protein